VVWISCLTNNFCHVQLFLPLSLAANIFSTQGVLPFTPNFARFTYVLFVLSVLVVVALIVSLNWASWFQSAGKLFRMATTVEKSEKICDVNTLARQFRQTFFRSSNPSQEDLETGLRTPTKSPNFRSRMNSNHAATWSLRHLMSFSYSLLSATEGEQHDLDGRLHEDRGTRPTRDPLSPTVNLETETSTPSLHVSRVYTPIGKRSPFTPFTSISNVLKRLLRPTPEADKQRIKWTCVSKTHPVVSYCILIFNCRDVAMSYMQTFRVVH
jgi:hypothetical protein